MHLLCQDKSLVLSCSPIVSFFVQSKDKFSQLHDWFLCPDGQEVILTLVVPDHTIAIRVGEPGARLSSPVPEPLRHLEDKDLDAPSLIAVLQEGCWRGMMIDQMDSMG